MRLLISSFVFLFAAQLAHAAPVGAIHACELESGLSLNKIDLLIPPLKNFANGDITVAYVTTEEPAAAPDHVLVFTRDQETGMFKECFAASVNADGSGFGSVDLEKIQSSYNAKTGLHLTIPVRIFDGEIYQNEILKLRVDRSNGRNKVTVE